MKFSKEPAVLLGLAASIIAAVTEALDAAGADGAFDAWALVRVGLPLLAGVAIRFSVFAPETLRSILDRADTGIEAARDLNARVKAQFPPTE